MGRWETFDHTADVGLKVTATHLNDLFQTAAEALFDYIVANRSDVRPAEHVEVSLVSEDTGDLLITWLNELIFLSETKLILYSEFNVSVAENGLSLNARIGGEPIDRARHVLDHEVKAVTRHGVELSHVEGVGWTAVFILDI